MRWWVWCWLGFLYGQGGCSGYVEGWTLPWALVRVSCAGEEWVLESDSSGYFRLGGLCGDSCRILVRVGRHYIADTLISLPLQGVLELGLWHAGVADVVIWGARFASLLHLDAEAIQSRPEVFLAQQLLEVPGVSLSGAGPLLQKPLLDGLGGTRIVYIQEGIPLASQQWGVEHAPEMDPHMGSELSVELGSRPVRYGTEAVGGVIRLGQESLCSLPSMQGHVQATGLTNGRGAVLNGYLQGTIKGWGYRLQGSGGLLGTLRAPHYLLAGTSAQWGHFSTRLQKTWSCWQLDGLYAQYNANIGIFWGQHVGNLADLEQALSASRPLVTGDFTYHIQAPYQEVAHELARLTIRYAPTSRTMWSCTYARQFNYRAEWDAVGVYARSGLPAARFQLTRHTLQLSWQKGSWEAGLGAHYERNAVGGSYFIPGYERYQPFGYFVYQRQGWMVGIRWEPIYWKVYHVFEREGVRRTGVVLSKVVRWWLSWGLELEKTWPFAHYQITARVAYLARTPNVAELYSYGYHQGRAAFEIGNPHFSLEKVWHARLEGWGETFSWGLSLYYSPSFLYGRIDSPIVSLRGAALSWRYAQEPVALVSWGAHKDWSLGRFWRLRLEGAVPLGWRNASSPAEAPKKTKNQVWRFLGLLPPPNATLSLAFNFARWQVKVGYRYHMRALAWDPALDLRPPPRAYGLALAELSYKVGPWRLSLSGDNLLNTSYRQYPDLMRYYADQMGRQLRFSVSYDF